ncbi:MAG: M48 family metalloprotease [candidate division SR1 bacterium]|nr:M48 family metalloprotease [candidate division SR1 bacterium]
MSAYSYQSHNQRKTIALLFLFVGLVSAIFYGFSTYYNQPFFAILGLVISIGQALVAYYAGGSLAIMSAGGQEISEQEAPQIHIMVENLSKIAGIPKPKIFISPDLSPNAFACGRDPEHANICLNQGILKLLNKNELEGVIAHELSHVKNRDILVMTVTMVLASVISFISDFAFRAMWWGRGDDDSDNKSPIVMVVYIIALVLAPFVALLIQLAISRSRESLADASAVVMTRYPKGLMDALTKLYESPVPTDHYSTATSHFFISPPKKTWGEKTSGLFSTHPPLEERIEALKKLS